jgi:hypothetical protein
MTFAPMESTILAGEDRGLLLSALRDLKGERPAEAEDLQMRELLRHVDRTQSVGLAVSVKKLGLRPLATGGSLQAAPAAWLRNLLLRAETIQGGITSSEDATLRLVLTCHGPTEAGELEENLQLLRELVPGLLVLLKPEPETSALLTALGQAEVKRDERTVVFTCRLVPAAPQM